MAYVLVVDDDDDIRDCLAAILADEGYAVETAVHGCDALVVLARRGRPCLILLDLMMPAMDGLELLDRLRSDPRTARIPVVVVTAAPPVQLPEGVKLLAKPVDVDDVLCEVERACSPRRGSRRHAR